MNKPVPHKWAEVIKAWADGKTVQWRWKRNPVWFDLLGPCPNFSDSGMEWRIKPEKKTGWINIYGTGEVQRVVVSASKEEADAVAWNGRIACIQISWEDGEGLDNAT